MKLDKQGLFSVYWA